MENVSKLMRVGHVLLLAGAFIVSMLCVSNLMPLLFLTLTSGVTIARGLLIGGYLIAGIVAIAILARAMYRLDKRAGRIKNRIQWFE